MTPDQLPPPGPERDAEIARLLGWRHDERKGWIAPGWESGDVEAPAYSTDPAACDRLEAELAARGFDVETSRNADDGSTHGVDARLLDRDGEAYRASAATRPDAVSAAALLALRSAS